MYFKLFKPWIGEKYPAKAEGAIMRCCLKSFNQESVSDAASSFQEMPVAAQAENQIPSFFRKIGNQLDVADCPRKLKLVFQPGFLQHI